jgi:predicted metal-dependent hydrolase
MQKTQNILYYKGIGEVRYVRSSRARNLSIRINRQGEVRVTFPRFVSQRGAERFLLSKQQWVIKRLNGLNQTNCMKTMPAVGGFIEIRGREYPVQLNRGEEDVEAAIWRLLREEAMNYLPGRVAEMCEKHGFQINGLKIRKMKTRWGSCTPRKSINLNSWLVMLPEHLSDYVILHELVHTRIPDHGKRFWDELDGVTGGMSRKLRRELHSHQIMCFRQTTVA